MLARLARVNKRLAKLKKDIFWGNLNYLDQLALKDYSATQQRLTTAETKLDEAHRIIEDCEQQLVTVQRGLQDALENLNALREQQAVQKTIKAQRQQLQDMIANLNQRLATYQAQLQQIDETRQRVKSYQQQIEQVDAQQATLKTEALSPLRAKLDQYSANLSELREVMTAIDLDELVSQLRHYVRQQKDYQKQYQGLVKQIEQGSQDVQIVTKMKGQMDQAIDQHAQGPLSGRLRDSLHQDNHQIHDDGASEMDQRVKQIIAQRDQLVAAHPDLAALLKTPDLLAELTNLQR